MSNLKNEFAWSERPAEEYRTDRLEQERERLNRRLVWAMRRQDVQAIERLHQRLDALEDAIDTDLAPGCPPNKFELYRGAW